jgi:hypothetical protein
VQRKILLAGLAVEIKVVQHGVMAIRALKTVDEMAKALLPNQTAMSISPQKWSTFTTCLFCWSGRQDRFSCGLASMGMRVEAELWNANFTTVCSTAGKGLVSLSSFPTERAMTWQGRRSSQLP